jgi:hypothetical protein
MRDQRFSPPNLLKASALHFHHIAIPRYHGHAAPLRGILPFSEIRYAPENPPRLPPDDDRAVLYHLVSGGIAPARQLTHARILLKSDEGPGGLAWKDTAIANALEIDRSTVARVRRQFVLAANLGRLLLVTGNLSASAQLEVARMGQSGIPVLLSMRSVYRDFGEVDLIDSLVAGVQSRIYRYLTLQQPCGRLYWTCTSRLPWHNLGVIVL